LNVSFLNTQYYKPLFFGGATIRSLKIKNEKKKANEKNKQRKVKQKVRRLKTRAKR
jgi:hypothetical protein